MRLCKELQSAMNAEGIWSDGEARAMSLLLLEEVAGLTTADVLMGRDDALLDDIKGWFSQLVVGAQEIGERPTAAFPSSHVGMSTVCMLLALAAKRKWLFWAMLPLWVLLVFATVYIKAHYVIDSLAGLLFAVVFFLLFSWVFSCWLKRKKNHEA